MKMRDAEKLTIGSMGDGLLLLTAARHVRSLTNALSDARGDVTFTGREVAYILEPVSMLLDAACERRLGGAKA
ncbi:MAG: hypothetical protein D6682_01880 [Zetaproteobacteria bacterium]|nr:MAG: hypothetical protein D6682_01880 [Zetaproteobacteria bacterium]